MKRVQQNSPRTERGVYLQRPNTSADAQTRGKMLAETIRAELQMDGSLQQTMRGLRGRSQCWGVNSE